MSVVPDKKLEMLEFFEHRAPLWAADPPAIGLTLDQCNALTAAVGEASAKYQAAYAARQDSAAELDAALVVDVDDLDLDRLSPILTTSPTLLTYPVGEFGDVAHAVGAPGELDEGAEVLGRDDLAGVDRADLDLSHSASISACAWSRLGVGATAIMTVPSSSTSMFTPYLLLQAADGLAAGADELADLVGVDLDGDEARGVRRDLGARRGDHLLHLLDDLEPALAGLLEDLLDLVEVQAAGLEVELDAGDALAGAGDLEVHVAEEVLLADDVGDEQLVLAVLVGEAADEMPATGALIGTPASISARHPPQTEAIDDEPLDSVMSLTMRMV
jgi:hypothetical protein